MATLILILCLLYFSSAIGDDDDPNTPTAHLIGGTSTQISNFPFQVSIKEQSSNKHVCGGAIITEKFVITAAHCVCFIRHPITENYIFVGSSALSGRGQKYNIEHGQCHAYYTTTKKLNDIAIIGVKGTITFNKFVKSASIMMSDITAGTNVIVSGWGYTSYPNAHQPDGLQKLIVPVISIEECRKSLKSVRGAVLDDSQFCTLVKFRRASICKGDSGGPVSLIGVLVGLVSWGVPCATGKPDANTKLSKYVKWITNTIDAYCRSRSCPSRNLYPKFVYMKKKHGG